jgi:glycine/serine hydroxymethyltransferase
MRIGTPALTTRGFKEAEFVQVADFIDRAVKIAKDCQEKTPAPGGDEIACGKHTVCYALCPGCLASCQL